VHTCPAAVDRYRLPAVPQQQTRRTRDAAAVAQDGTDRQTDRETDRRPQFHRHCSIRILCDQYQELSRAVAVWVAQRADQVTQLCHSLHVDDAAAPDDHSLISAYQQDTCSPSETLNTQRLNKVLDELVFTEQHYVKVGETVDTTSACRLFSA